MVTTLTRVFGVIVNCDCGHQHTIAWEDFLISISHRDGDMILSWRCPESKTIVTTWNS